MALPLKYNLRNVLIRWRTTVFTILGIAAVVAVFLVLRGMASGMEHTSGNTGDPRNILVVRKGSQAESGSLVTRDQFRTLQYFEEIARNEKNEPVISAELVMIVSAPRRGAGGEANTLLRGVTPRGMELRPQVTLKEGRWFTPGKREVVVAQRLAARFDGFELGGTIKAGPDRLTVVGHFDATGSAFDSEAWMDADECRSIFDREMYSSLLLRPRDEAALTNLLARIQSDKRLSLRAEREVDYYAKQTLTAKPLKYIASILGVVMSVGAFFAAMNTMYATVAARTREIGTLRVLGFSRFAIVLSFLIEGTFLAMLGGVLGSLLAWSGYAVLSLLGVNFGTLDFQSFAETVFQFRVTPDMMLLGVLLSAVIGFTGSFPPALRAARLPVISALKSL